MNVHLPRTGNVHTVLASKHNRSYFESTTMHLWRHTHLFCFEGIENLAVQSDPTQEDGSMLVELDIRYSREDWAEIQRL